MKRIDSPYAVVLTGTPLENKLEELISIVQFVDQHRLGPTWKLLHEHQVKDEAGRVTGYTWLQRIGQMLAPVMIRRRKSEALMQLPARTDHNLMVPMTELDAAPPGERHVVARIVSRCAERISFRQGSATADLRPAEHAHGLQTAPTCSTRRATTASRRTSGGFVLLAFRAAGGQGGGVAANGRARTTS